MIHLLGPRLPKDIWVACSGGVDSMCAWSFFSNNSIRNVKLAFFHHGTEDSQKGFEFLSVLAKESNTHLEVGYLEGSRPKGESPEEFWRNKRYEFLHSLNGTVVSGHHLDDCVENYLFSSIHGKAYTIPYRNRNVVRPFLTTSKGTLERWCMNKNIPWVYDDSNSNERYMRNYIRKNLMPHVEHINPGIRKVVKRIVLDENRKIV